jgi:DNA-binding GntR family transcriptional regulator
VIQDDDVVYLTDLTDDMAAAVKKRDVMSFGTALRATATGFARIEGNAARATVIERLGPQIRRFSQHSKDVFDWDAVSAFITDLRDAMRERDAVKTRAVIVTLFDESFPAIIDRAEEAGVHRIGAE